MNNGILTENYNGKMENSRVPFLQKRSGEVKQILEILNELQKNQAFRRLNSLALLPRLESALQQMKFEIEPIKLYRLQGKVGELENLTDLNKLLDLYNNELLNLTKQIKNASQQEN